MSEEQRNVDCPTLNTISLFSGVGMLDEGLHAGLEYLGVRSRTVLFAEREAYPVSVLAARMEEGSIPAAPIWFGDLCELPAEQFCGVVDGIIAGFPCQDISVAGLREGLDGKRSGLFFEIPKLADACGAWFLFLENVAGIASAPSTVVDEAEGELEERAAARVVGELADLGWNAEWLTISASDVGASHGRARWFCLAWRMGTMGYTRHNAGSSRDRQQSKGANSGSGQSSKNSNHVADTQGRGSQRQRSELARGSEVEGASEYLGNARLQHILLQQREDGAKYQGAVSQLDNPVSFRRGARRHADGKHDGDIANATGQINLADTASEGFEKRRLGIQRQLSTEIGSRLHNRLEFISSELADTDSPRSQGRQFSRACNNVAGGATNIWIN